MPTTRKSDPDFKTQAKKTLSTIKARLTLSQTSDEKVAEIKAKLEKMKQQDREKKALDNAKADREKDTRHTLTISEFCGPKPDGVFTKLRKMFWSSHSKSSETPPKFSQELRRP